MARKLIVLGEDIPLIGSIAFGLIDRGTNLIQVRPSTQCPLSCIFCSTDAGPNSRWRQVEYLVPPDLLVDAFKQLAIFKGGRKLEAHIDTVGDPLTYPHLVELVSLLREVPGVEVISMQTHGVLLTEKLADDLASAGLSRVNLSIDALDPELAKKMAGTQHYDVTHACYIARYIAENTSMDIIITPLWLPKFNDAEIPKLIEFALKIGAGKQVPALGIQKYEMHKHGRKVKGVKPQTWYQFYQELRLLEKRFKTKLVLSPSDFGMFKCQPLPKPYRKGEVLSVKVVELGWLRGEVLAIPPRRDRVFTVVGIDNPELLLGQRIKAVVIGNKDNIYIAKPA